MSRDPYEPPAGWYGDDPVEYARAITRGFGRGHLPPGRIGCGSVSAAGGSVANGTARPSNVLAGTGPASGGDRQPTLPRTLRDAPTIGGQQ